MKPLRFCLDTSTFGGLTDEIPDGRREATQAFFERAILARTELYVSSAYIDEIGKAPAETRSVAERWASKARVILLEETRQTLAVAQTLVERRLFSKKSHNDARHLSVAIVAGMDAVVSWNFRHMVNFERRRKVGALCLELGYKSVDIISPEEALR